MKKPYRRVLIALCAAILGSCGGSGRGPVASPAPVPGEPGRTVRPGAPGEPSLPVAPGDVTVPALPHTDADVRFMQRMIVHHGQALTLTSLVAGRAGSREIELLARRMEMSQEDELSLMRTWLADRNEPVPHLPDAAHATHQTDLGGPMPGMLDPEQLERLASATGREFERLFLVAMIGHHEGALEMVAELFATPGAAQEDEIFQFASHVESDQRLEVARMNRMLAEYR